MWKTVMLGEYITVQNGYAFNSKLFDADGEIGLIRIRDLKEGVSTETRYTGDYDRKFVVQRGDLLIGMDGEFRCYEWKGENALLNQRVCRLQDFDSELDKRFLLYAINDELKKIEDVTGFTTVKHLSSKAIKEIQLYIPPLVEQQRIVAKLDAAFAEIDDSAKYIKIQKDKLSRLHRKILETSFEVDFPKKRLADVKGVKSGGTPKSSEKTYWEGNIEWFSSGELNSMYVSSTQKKITQAGLENSNAKIFPKDTLLIGMYDTAAMKMSILQNDATFNQAIVGIPPNPHFSSEYLFYALNYLKPEILLERRGVRQQNLSLAKVKEIDVPMPTEIQQQEIVTHLNKSYQNIAIAFLIYEKKLKQLDALKSAILAQELQSEAA